MKWIAIVAALALAVPITAQAQTRPEPARPSANCSIDVDEDVVSKTEQTMDAARAELSDCRQGDIIFITDMTPSNLFEFYIGMLCDYSAAIRTSELRVGSVTARIASCVYAGHVRKTV